MSDERYDPSEALFHLNSLLNDVDASEDDYVLFGSIPMWFTGIREDVGDIDVFVRPHIWNKLLSLNEFDIHTPNVADPSFLEYRNFKWPKIHIFYAWNQRDTWMDVERCYRDAVTDERTGWRYAPLTEVTKWKLQALRTKDIDDLFAINEYWESKENAKA